MLGVEGFLLLIQGNQVVVVRSEPKSEDWMVKFKLKHWLKVAGMPSYHNWVLRTREQQLLIICQDDRVYLLLVLVKRMDDFFVQPVRDFHFLVLTTGDYKLLLCFLVIFYENLHNGLEVNLRHFGYRWAIIQWKWLNSFVEGISHKQLVGNFCERYHNFSRISSVILIQWHFER